MLRAQVVELAAAAATEPDEPLGTEWLPTGSPIPGAGLRRPARVSVSAADVAVIRSVVTSEIRETLASLGETLAALDVRLATIERQLGIAAPAKPAKEPAEPAEESPEAESPEAESSGESAE